jgi:hypothetical protein
MAASDGRVRLRFWAEAPLAVVTGALVVLTLFWRDWLEAFGIDPDRHNGSVEWLIAGILLVACVASSIAARAEWRRGLPAR